MLVCKLVIESHDNAFVFAPGVNAPEGADEIEVHLPGGVNLKEAGSDRYAWFITPAENAGERDVYRVTPYEDSENCDGFVPSPLVFETDEEYANHLAKYGD